MKSILEAEEEERLRELFGSREKWHEAVELFFRHVEQRYLSDMLAEGLITTSRTGISGPNAAAFDEPGLLILFGNVSIKLLPIFSPTPDSLGLIDVRASSGVDKDQYIVCDLTRGWLAPARETGLRWMLSRYLPEKLVPLDEDLFVDILCDAIEAREPIFTYDRDRVMQRLSLVLDDLLDPARTDSLSRLVNRGRLLPAMDAAKRLTGAAMRSRPLRLAPQKPQPLQLQSRLREEDEDGRIAEG
ncbi:hypothetical protein [Lichenibacterium ramalinae]|uniref:hypothetical protein n=1 Tax=Lichenibacterium ramalinae TaxID=2316527 RepID=UPI00100EB81C|nr:hypothetical protein [Lichenibacterium ramalinae]